MSDYERTMELVETAQNSAGRSSQQFAKYADSVEYSVKRLSNTWEQFRVNLANNDFYKDLIDTLNTFLEKISNFDGADWAKFGLGFFVLGKSVIHNFLEGSQKALSEIAPAFKKNFEALQIKAKNGITNTNLFQRMALGYKPKTAEDFSAQVENNRQSYLQLQNDKYQKEVLNPILDKLEKAQDKYNKAYNNLNKGKNQQKAEEAIAEIKAQEKAYKDAKEAQSAYMQEKEDWYNEHDYTSPKVLADEYNRQHQLTEAQAAMKAEAFTAIGKSAAAAFTAAFTTAMLTDEPGEVFKASLLSGATAAVPGVLNTIITGLQSNKGNIGEALAGGLQAGLASVAVSLAIAAIAAGIKLASKEIKEHNEEVLEMESAYYKVSKEIETLKEKEEELGKIAYIATAQAEKTSSAYTELASKTKELEELRNKILLTNDESSRLTEVSNEIAKIAPELVSSYDIEGNAVIALKDSYNELLEAKKKNMLQDQLKADQVLEDVAENQLQQAFKNRKEAQELYQSTLGEDRGIQLLKTDIRMINNSLTGAAFTLNDAELKKLGSQAKKIYANIDELDFIQNLEDIEVIERIQKELEDLPLDEQNKLLDKMNKAIDSVSNDYTQLDQEIKNAINAYIQSSKQLITTQLQLNSKTYEEQEDKNVQNFISDYILQSAGLLNITEEELQKRFKEYLQKQPLILQEGTKEYDDAYYDWVSNLFNNIEINEDDLEDTFTEQIIAIISQIENLKLDLPELAKYLATQLGGEDSELFKTWVGQNAIRIAQHNERVENAGKVFGLTPGNGIKTVAGGIYTTTDSRLNAVLGASHSDNFVDKINTWANVGKQEKFINTFASFTNEELSAFFDIDWESLNSTEYQEAISTFAKEWKKAPKDIENILSTLNLYDYIPANTDALKDEIDERIKAYDKYDKKIKAMQTAGDSWAKDGKVSASGIEALYNAGFEVFKLVDENLQFNAGLAKETIEEQINGELRLNKIQKERIDDALKARTSMLRFYGEGTYSLTDLSSFTPEDINSYFVKGTNNRYTLNIENTKASVENLKEESSKYSELIAALEYLLRTLLLENESVFKGISEELDKTSEKIEKAREAVNEAYEDVLEKQQAVIDKQEELNKVLYGDENHKNKLDELYNYNTAIETIEDSISDAKEALDDLDGKDPTEFLDAWISGTHQKAANVQAANDRYAAAIDSINSMLTDRLTDYLTSLGRGVSTNVSDYYNYNPELDRYEVNYQQLNAAQMNDDLKDFIEEQIDLMNQHKKAIKKNQDDLKKLEKEFEDYQKKIRDDYISVQESIAKTLEEFYKKEIEDKKEMYDALKEADDKYLDALEKAIEKERKLRDRQDKWNSLATKEKKLSLLQRDTSGANQKQVQSLQKEIEKERQSILDNAVDTIVDNLKELYEEQQETREIELEYQEVLQENTDYIAEANSLLQSWKTVDEMREWMWGHTKDIDKMSDQAVEKLTEDWADMFDTIQTYNAMTAMEFSDAFDVSGQEVQRIVLDTSETLTSEADRAFGEITTQVNTAIESAEKAVSEALKALADAQEKYNEKLAEFNKLITEYKELTKQSDNITPSSIEPPTDYSNNYTKTEQILGDTLENYVVKAKEEYEREVKLQSDFPDLYNDWYNGKGYHITKPANDPEYYHKEELVRELGGILARDESNYGTVMMFKDSDVYNDYMTSIGRFKNITRFKKGGLANYTGPAWVDGTPSRPEAFLNAEDTARIGEAANIFASVASLSTNGSLSSGLSQSIGDTNVQLNIHVDSIATPEQVDYLIDRVKEEFVNVANPIGTAVILHQ